MSFYLLCHKIGPIVVVNKGFYPDLRLNVGECMQHATTCVPFHEWYFEFTSWENIQNIGVVESLVQDVLEKVPVAYLYSELLNLFVRTLCIWLGSSTSDNYDSFQFGKVGNVNQ